MDLSKYKDKGRIGLENLGNTCFLNSCMQVLNHTYELNHFLDSEKHKRTFKEDLPDASILIEWDDLRKVMWSGNGIVSPNRFVHNVHKIASIKGRDIFTGWAQNDMSEFLLFFMDCLHNSISRGVNMKVSGNPENNVDKLAIASYNMLKTTYSKEYSEIMDMFYGIYVSEIISINGLVQHVVKPESFFILDLPILDGGNLAGDIHDCFKYYIKPEVLEGDNAWYNEKTKTKEDIKKQISFFNFPKVLVITLKRFSPDGQHKLNSLVKFPLENLDLSPYVRGYNKESYKYDLFGVCNHMGGVMGGHYTAYVRNSENQWLHCNDRNVDVVQNPEIIIAPMAYCLFYRKKNNLV
jgi:ubiquitin carboxyl-terminal hydrolase 8